MHRHAVENGSRPEETVYHNLPIQPTPLVGRGREAAAVTSMLRRPDVRLLTLIGPPGIGKTRLGVQAASELLGDFADGVSFVALAAITDPDLVAPAIAHTLGIRGTSSEPLVERLKGYLHSKQMLLLVDNFEQVVTAAPLLSDLLAGCPHVKMLVTSRELLRLYGEHDYPVPPLSLPDLDRLPGLKALSDYDAIHLFVQRAQSVNPRFELTDRNAPAAAEICLRLDGLPLAIELAAARTLVLPPEDLLTRLKNRLSLLTGGPRNLPERQRTLQAAIDWSHNLLEPGEQALFRRLGIFVGGFTLEAIEQICGAMDPAVDTLDGVTSLVGKSLLQRQEGQPGEQRFMMLETIREYAREKLEEAGELESIGDRHLDYFVRFAEDAELGIIGHEQIPWMRRLDAEQNNVRAALEWSLSANSRAGGVNEGDGRSKKGLRLVGALGRYWQYRGYVSEGQMWCAQLLGAADPSRPGAERAKALRTLAMMMFEQGDFAESRSIYQKSLEMSRAVGDDREVAWALRGLASAALWYGEYDLSLSYNEEALSIGRRLGAENIISSALSQIGTLLMLKEEYRAAQPPVAESLAIERKLGNRAGIANDLTEQGSVAFHLGKYDKARALHEESLGFARELGVDWVIAKVLARLSVVALRQGDSQYAEALLREGLSRAQVSGNRRWSRWYLVGLAEIARLDGMITRAAKLIGASEGASSAVGARYEPGMRAEIEQTITNVRAELGEETFEALSAEGRAMSPEETVTYALESPARVAPDAAANPDEVSGGTGVTGEGQQPHPNDLTEREMEVLRLIAAGKSNQEIAQGLVLSLRTVERHISNIYQKIGATGRIARATATAYALRHGLAEG
jgi:predicted ATPase/DNA-binding CsgD family transcriptional regulator